MKREYDLQKLFDIQISETIFDKVKSPEDYKYWVESYIEINKPDFICVMSVENTEEQLIYSRNYNLEFPKDSQQSLKDIVRAVPENQISRIYEADRLCVRFLDSNKIVTKSPLFQLRFTTNLIENKSTTLQRDIVFIPSNQKGKIMNVFIMAFTDITDIDGVHNYPKMDIKCFSQDPLENNMIENLKNKVTNILMSRKSLTPREEQILELVSEGKSSEDISGLLRISINTVNTHRQNLIRKFGVKNMTALINII
ncbi:response regulator transcription factor [Aestuariibaculum sediminum]|uniref:Helix-turn-helix transcriptional regulator n=1 Tax=Aestuariibaculum sediminum TaxID=2770637 RepID=A0A8J6Q5B3_9FLAO|nr:helix-turn-helix transcriptional regulator [Aestuariibaculum sediminum]MBD0830508.1 helix-turn-helix transcriptional regulator [Aestuariibaculum sediminum]